ncbi:MAG: hypothetical protein ACR2RV_14615 [Verrucomicrobiales bacterium]
MAKTDANLDRTKLSVGIREGRRKKGWTLEQLARELWALGLPTAQNKLWRLENKPPQRIDTELLLWLEKLLGVELIESHRRNHILIGDVVDLLDHFIATGGDEPLSPAPENPALQPIYEKMATLSRVAQG